MEKLTIAVDGYASSGKGSVCKRLAKRLGIMHLDTGALYRAIGLYVLENNLDYNNDTDIMSHLSDINIAVDRDDDKQVTLLNGMDVSRKIRVNKVSDITSIISQYSCVRDFILSMQRDIAEKHDLIMEGRDITSHVLPDAEFKFMLNADVSVRAERRWKELQEKGEDVTFDQIKAELIERDKRDTTRKIAPLILTEGTIYIDNTHMTIDEEVDLMYNIIVGDE